MFQWGPKDLIHAHWALQVFCLQLSGDSQTSRRLPEALLGGCIPVSRTPGILGRPYHEGDGCIP